MAAPFLHGVETIVLNTGPRPITVVKSSVICIVGLAPKGGDKNNPVMVVTDSDAAAFGSKIPGFDIPFIIDEIRKTGAGTIIVVNTFDSTANVAAITDETHVVTTYKTKTAFAPISGIVVKNSAGSTTYVKGTDYTIDDFGNLTVINPTSINEGSTIKISYNKLDLTTVNAAQIVGTLTSGVRTGLQVLDLVYPTFGFNPKVIVCPDWNTNVTVAAAMKTKADYWRAIYLLDAATGLLPSDIASDRGPAGAVNISTVSPRAYLLYPHLKVDDPDPSAATGATILRPASEFAAAVIAQTDNDFGYWYSPSNKQVDDSVLGTELLLTFLLNKADTDINVVNSYGVTSFIKDTNWYMWGNRNASFPSQSGITTFLSTTRVSDIIAESIEFFTRPYIDQPINDALISTITESVNGFLRTLIGRGAIIDGSCTYDPNNNPSDQLANGQIVFNYEFVSPPPAERVTYQSYININLLNTLAA